MDLDINRGEILTLIGKSGVGKSILLKLLINLIEPDSGRILFEGRPLDALTKAERKAFQKKMSYVFQGTALLDSLTVFENVALPLQERRGASREEIRRRVREKLQQLDLVDIDEKYPSQLSGGMKKRVALARALVTEPEVVLFDEPTTGLDPIRKHAVHRLITDYQKKFGFTAVLVSHEIPDVFLHLPADRDDRRGPDRVRGDAGGAAAERRPGRPAVRRRRAFRRESFGGVQHLSTGGGTMKRTSLELAVGVFVFIGMLAVGYLTVKLGRMEMFQGDYYLVTARFQNVAGLKSGSSVEIAGVPVGRVSAIRVNPENFAAMVEMKIDKGVALTDDTIASVKTQGLIGDKYIKLSPGGSETDLKSGDTMVETESAIDIEELISKYVMGKV